MKSLLKVIAIISLTALSSICTAQKLYSLPNSTAVLLVEDAYRNRAKDTLLVAMGEQHKADSLFHNTQVAGLKTQLHNCESRNENLDKQLQVQSEIHDDVASEVGIYKKSSRGYKRQRNAIGVFLLVVAGVVVSRD